MISDSWSGSNGENPYACAASCTRCEDDDDVWEDYVGMMEVDAIEEELRVPCIHVHRERLKEKFPRYHRRGRKRRFRTQEMSRRNGLVCVKNVRDDVRAARRLQEVIRFARVQGIMVNG